MTEMKRYVGTKTVDARPMTRAAYNDYRGWKLPADENGDDAGFLVEYVDGGKSNDSRHAGYISWSPAGVFERSYKPAQTFRDRLAIERDELATKFVKLGEFIDGPAFGALPLDERNRLGRQFAVMGDYLAILQARILAGDAATVAALSPRAGT